MSPPVAPDAEQDLAGVPTDLSGLVTATRQAAELAGVTAPPPPWLPPLGEVVTVDHVLESFPQAAPGGDNLALPIGLADIPSRQCRVPALWDLAHGSHLAVAGSSRSGRSTVLRAVGGLIGRFCSPGDVHLYGIDCGSNALMPLSRLPHTGAVVTRDQADRLTRLTTRLKQVITARQERLAANGFADVAEQRAHTAGGEKLPYIVVLFDGWESFFQLYDQVDGGQLVSDWQQILQEGAGVGIRVCLTGDRSVLFGRLATFFADRLALKLQDQADYSAVGMKAAAVPAAMPPGRAFRSEGAVETQIALLDPDHAGKAQVQALHAIAGEARNTWGDLDPDAAPFRVDTLPARVAAPDLDSLAGVGPRGPGLRDSELAVAVGGDTLRVLGLDAYEHGPALLVAGPRRSGRSTTLRMLASSAMAKGWPVVTVTPRVSPLRTLSGPAVYGPFDGSCDEPDVKALLARLANTGPHLVLVDDFELLDVNGALSALLGNHVAAIRDTGAMLAAAAVPEDVARLFNGLGDKMRRVRSGFMLAPQAPEDLQAFGAQLPRSALGRVLPPGGGYLVRVASCLRAQVIWPGDIE
jgi:S-DNA-T family DNA segregation ATPase FtsK/SpoIIIE